MAKQHHEAVGQEATDATWVGLINESVHTSDDKDIGDIEAVSKDFVVVRSGFRKIHRYYIPISLVEGWDRDVLWLKITEDEVKMQFERDVVPDHSRYFMENMGDNKMYYGSARLPELRILQTRYAKPTYPVSLMSGYSGRFHRCDLCETSFDQENDLSAHVLKDHGEVPMSALRRAGESPVLDWEATVHKNVRAADGTAVGNVGAVTDETLVVLRGPSREFIIPKSRVDGFDGAEVRLNIPYPELEASYKRITD